MRTLNGLFDFPLKILSQSDGSVHICHPSYDPKEPFKLPAIILPCEDGLIFMFGFEKNLLPLGIEKKLKDVGDVDGNMTLKEVFALPYLPTSSTSPPKKCGSSSFRANRGMIRPKSQRAPSFDGRVTESH